MHDAGVCVVEWYGQRVQPTFPMRQTISGDDQRPCFARLKDQLQQAAAGRYDFRVAGCLDAAMSVNERRGGLKEAKITGNYRNLTAEI